MTTITADFTKLHKASSIQKPFVIEQLDRLFALFTKAILIYTPIKPALSVISSWQLVLSEGGKT